MSAETREPAATPPPGTQEPAPAPRKVADMDSWEVIGCYRHAWNLASYRPPPMLAKQLAGFLLTCERELKRRDEWRPDYLQSP